MYRHSSPEGDYIADIDSSSSMGSSCKGRIFDKFFSQSVFKEVPFSSYAKIGLCIAAAAYLSYKAYQEVQKSRKRNLGQQYKSSMKSKLKLIRKLKSVLKSMA
jgi:hypothetical protein